MKPHKYSLLNSNNIADDKVLNIILIDDSFSNKHGYIYNQDRILIMDDIINGICQNFPIKSKDHVFSHGGKFQLPDNKILIGSYHPSPRNVNTRRIDISKMVLLLEEVKKILKNKKW